MQSKINDTSIRNGDRSKIDGKDNLNKLHQYLASLKAKGLIKGIEHRTVETTPQPKSSRYKNYLSELRDSGTSNSERIRHKSIDYISLAEQDAEKIKFNAERR